MASDPDEPCGQDVSGDCGGTPRPNDVQPPTSTTKSIWDRARQTLTEATAHASVAGGVMASKAVEISTPVAVKATQIGRRTLEVAGATVDRIDGELEQRGAKQLVKETAGAVVGKLDEVTGKRLLELLEEKLAIQDTYNDILATRLAEALERIAKLEAEVGKHTNEN